MADITMCSGEGCEMRMKCYRHTATACPYRQSYFVNAPLKDGKCEYFMKAREGQADE